MKDMSDQVAGSQERPVDPGVIYSTGSGCRERHGVSTEGIELYARPEMEGFQWEGRGAITQTQRLHAFVTHESAEYPKGPFVTRFLTQSSFNQRSSHSRPSN